MQQPAVHRSEDGWVIVTAGYEINRFIIDFAIVIEITNQDSDVKIRIESEFQLDDGQTRHTMSPEKFSNLEHLFKLLRKAIIAVAISEQGRLEVEIDRAIRLIVEPDERYEAWTLSANNGLLVVCLPGGGVALWEPSVGASDGPLAGG